MWIGAEAKNVAFILMYQELRILTACLSSQWNICQPANKRKNWHGRVVRGVYGC